MSISDSERQSLRTQVVDEHVRLENRHDLNGIMTTFGAAARYDDEPWDAHYIGRDSVRAFYSDLLRALPDLQIDVQRSSFADVTWVPGAACRRPVVLSNFRSVASTHSTTTTGSRARRSTMTAPPCFAS